MGAAEASAEQTIDIMKRAVQRAFDMMFRMMKEMNRTRKAAIKEAARKIERKLAEIAESKNPNRAMENVLQEQARHTKNQLTIALENGGISMADYNRLCKDVDDLKYSDGDLSNASAQYASMAYTEGIASAANEEYEMTKNLSVYERLPNDCAEYMRVPQAVLDQEKYKGLKEDPRFAGKYEDVINSRKDFRNRMKEKIRGNKLRDRAEKKGKVFESRSVRSERIR